MIKKYMWLVTGITVLTLLSTACGSGGGSSKDTAKDGNSSKDAVQWTPNNEPVELIFYSNGDTAETFDLRFGGPIRKKFPNYTIKFIERVKGATGSGLAELIAAGTQIDIYYESIGGYMDNLTKYNLQHDMTDLIKKHNVDLSRFEVTSINAAKAFSKSGIVGLPVLGTSLGLYYNKDIFDKFGVPYLKDGMNWDEMLEVAGKLTRDDGTKPYMGLAVSQVHWLRLNPYAKPYVEQDKAVVNNETWKKVMETGIVKPTAYDVYKSVIQKNKNTLPSGNSLVKDRDLAIYIGLSDLFIHTELWNDFSNMSWDMASVPTFKDLPGVGPQLYPIYFGVSSSSKSKDAAMEVIKYLTSDELQLELSKQGSMSVLKSDAVLKAFGSDNPFKDKNLKSIFYNKFAPIAPKTPYDSIAEKYLRTDIIPMIMGTTDFNTALRKAEDTINKAIEDEKKK